MTDSRLVISLDFESYWGVHDKRSVEAFPDRDRLAQAVHGLLDLFQERGVRATWATVGMLMCDGVDECMDLAPPEDQRPAYTRTAYDLLQAASSDPRLTDLLFAPDLVRAIRDTAGQEIGSHSFSHYYCAEPRQDGATFEADLQAAKAAAKRHNVKLKSFVFPRNQVRRDYVPLLEKHGISCFRGNPDNALWRGLQRRPRSRWRRAMRLADDYLRLAPSRRATSEDGAGEIRADRFLRVTGNERLNRMHLRRIASEMRRAHAQARTYHLWWHPHNIASHPRQGMRMVEAVVGAFEPLRGQGMRSSTMAEAV